MRKIILAACCLLLVGVALSAAAAVAPGESHLTFTEDGAWCWFQDPRAVYVEGAYKRTYANWMTRDGRLQVGWFDHETGESRAYTLKENWGADDHNMGSFLVLPDKRLMVFYATHGSRGLYCRTSKNPEDISEWEEEVTIVGGRGVTYSHPVYLTDEKLFYVFWRGSTRKPTFSTSADGKIWSEERVLIEQPGRDYNPRPYLKVVSDGKSSIHFAFTDGHPHNEPTNSIYYLRYEKGSFHKADGTRVGGMDSLPIPHSDSDLVYDAEPSRAIAWVWDIALDRAGHPVIAYTRIPDHKDHRYHYARWTGVRWRDTELCAAGGWFPQTQEGVKEREPCYSGGLCLDHSNPSVVYLSRQVNGIFEIEKWTTWTRGVNWSSEAITQDSKNLNVRPIVPRGYAGKRDHVLWMHGPYVHFTDFQTGVKCFVSISDT